MGRTNASSVPLPAAFLFRSLPARAAALNARTPGGMYALDFQSVPSKEFLLYLNCLQYLSVEIARSQIWLSRAAS
jgi:hypothetical protein